MTYAALHNHTSLSILDGFGHPQDHVLRAKELGLAAVSITDHGSLSGVFKFWKAAKAAGIKPILGIEAYLAPGDRTVRERAHWGDIEEGGKLKASPGGSTHISLLAANSTGLRNLYRMQEAAYLTGFYGYPRLDQSLLATFAEGVIVLSGCVGGSVATRLRLNQWAEAAKEAEWFKTTFPGRYFIEIMANGMDFEAELNPKLAHLAQELDLPLVGTIDSHYPSPGDSQAHACLLCVQTQSTLLNPKFAFSNDQFYIKSHDEMLEAFKDYPEAVENTLKVAELVGDYDEMFQHQNLMPEGDIEVLRDLAYEGLMDRDLYGKTEYSERLEYELQVIGDLQYAGYFLNLADDVQFARQQGILVGNGRGSGGASLVAYATGITNIDPLLHGLLFERFLNKERKSYPDIDFDAESRGREQIVQHAIDRAGPGKACRIITFGTIATKRAILDASKVLGRSIQEANRLKGLIPPPKRGRTVTLSEVPEIGKQDAEVYRIALGLEGQYRNTGIHPGGLVLSPVPLSDVVPVKQGPNDPGLIAAFEMGEIEELGLVKFDYLGVTTLDIIQTTLEFIGKDHNWLHGLDLADSKSYSFLREGKLLGVFQLGESWARGIIRDVQPDCFDDIVALVALIRPGSTDNGVPKEYARRKFTGETMPDIHPEVNEDFEPLLKRSRGCAIFQEDALAIIKETTGWHYGQADLLLRAFGKKDLQKLAAARPAFMEASKYSSSATECIWELLAPFADYAFNRAHSVGYAYTTFWTLYLKAHYPSEFIAATLSHVDGKTAAEKLQKTIALIREANREGITVLPPDINASQDGFTPTKEGIRYGLGAIRDVGPTAVASIYSARPLATLDDLFRRVDSNVLSIRVLSALIRSGCLDSLWGGRESLLAEAESISRLAQDHRVAAAGGQQSLVRLKYQPQTSFAPDWEQRKADEIETLGVQLSHPRIMLKVPGSLTASESHWLYSILAAREPESEVYLCTEGYRVKLNLKSSARGLAHAVSKIGAEVELG